jgi:hypothetical protein
MLCAAGTCTADGPYLELRNDEWNYQSMSVQTDGSHFGPGIVTSASGENPTYGTVSDSVLTGQGFLSFTITWNDNEGRAHYAGQVDKDGTVHGAADGPKIPVNLWTPGLWHSTSHVTCTQSGSGGGQKLSANVVNDVDVYNITDGPGKHKIGTLRAPSVVPLVEPCSFDAFCHVSVPDMEGGNGFAWAPNLLEPA